MTRLMVEFMGDAINVFTKKNPDYHPDNVAYLEILETAFESGITVEQDLWGRSRKQTSALKRYLFSGVVESEPARSRMVDVAVYMSMLAVWDTHKTYIVGSAFQFVQKHRQCEAPSDSPSDPRTCSCDRCQFLRWLGDLLGRLCAVWDSKETSSPPIPREPG